MEAQNAPTPTGQLAPPTWAKSSFFVLILHSAIYGHMWHFWICAQKTLRRSERKLSADSKIIVSASPNIYWSNKKDLNGTRRATLRTTVLKMPSLIFGEIRWVAIFHQNAKNRSFYELRRDFWFKSVLLDQKYILLYEYLWYLVLTVHFSSFSAFLVVRKKRGKFLKMSSKDEQWRVMTSNHIIS